MPLIPLWTKPVLLHDSTFEKAGFLSPKPQSWPWFNFLCISSGSPSDPVSLLWLFRSSSIFPLPAFIASVSCLDKATASGLWRSVSSDYSTSEWSSAPRWLSLSLKTLATSSIQLLTPATYSFSRRSLQPRFSWPGTPALSRNFSFSSQFTHCLSDAWWPFAAYPSSLHPKQFVIPIRSPRPHSQSSWDVVAAPLPHTGL